MRIPFMVKEGTKKGKKYFTCGECGFSYAEERWAEKCERWCKEHKSCNLEIIKYAVKKS